MVTKKQEKQETQVAILTPKKVRGTATIYACGDVEFKAYGEGTPQKEVLRHRHVAAAGRRTACSWRASYPSALLCQP